KAKEVLNDNESVPALTPTPTPLRADSFFRNYSTALRWVTIVTPLVFFLFYELYLFKRRKLVLQKQHGKKPPLVWPIYIEAASSKPYDSELFYSAARLMRRRQADAFQQLDIGATVAATLESLGYPSFQYKLHSKPPEYLVLIDRASFRDHQAKLFDELTKALEREGLFVTRYFYNGDPRICCDETGKYCLGLAELHSQFAGHRLLLIGDGSRLLDPVTGRLAFWTSIFVEWQERALLSPRPPFQWGLFEVTLSHLFAVHPATTAGLLSLVDYFDSTVTKDLRSWKQGDSKGSSLYQPDHPYSVESLRQYLGEETFQWLCACAVYPELQWELTLYLGSLPVMEENLVREENLLRLGRLTWFQNGSIPDDARWRLIQELDRNKEMAIRIAIINLLEKNPPPKETFAAVAYQLNLVVQRWLHYRDRKRRRQMLEVMRTSPQNKILRDYTVLRHLESPAISPLNLALPHRLRRIFYRKGIPAFGLKTGVRLVIALSLVGAGWMITKEWQKVESNALNEESNQDRPIAYPNMISIPGGT
ncbi:MAG TPA: hypothetical protein VFQ47_03720, partial [Nitrososphaera sp.]|nr:hypothetical protein [Nitrososphaera sp.]